MFAQNSVLENTSESRGDRIKQDCGSFSSLDLTSAGLTLTVYDKGPLGGQDLLDQTLMCSLFLLSPTGSPDFCCPHSPKKPRWQQLDSCHCQQHPR